ncbi:MAG: O-antigen ligase family protein, partial [Lentisphaeria bacterium]|nr:O-antigen ligase family protein [Lentisphaeria bacterium]
VSTLPLLVVVIMNAISDKNWPKLSIAGLGFISVLSGVFLSSSRGAYVLAIVAIVLTLYLFKTKSKKKSSTKSVLIILCVILFAGLTPMALEKELDSKGMDWSGREKFYKVVPDIAQDLPLGTGPGGYRFISASYLADIKHSRVIPHHSENTYFQMFLEQGMICFVLLCVMAQFYIKRGLDNNRNHKLSTRLKIAASASLLCLLAHSIYDYGFHIPAFALNIAVLMGFLMCKGETYEEDIQTENEFKFRFIPMLLPIVSLIFIAVVFVKFKERIHTDERFNFAQKKSLQGLANNISRQPTSWHNWYFMGYRVLQKNDPKNLLFVEKCFKQAALYNPNYSDLWLQLAQVRKELKNKEGMQAAFTRYFLLLHPNQRKKMRIKAFSFLGVFGKELDNLIHRQFSPKELTPEFIQSI